MEAIITPKPLTGMVEAIPSKSVAHRQLVCAAFADAETAILCSSTSADIDATARCLEALGARIDHTERGFRVTPVSRENVRRGSTLDCGESGSTLRFLLPVAAALGCDARFVGHGRLANRPLSPLYEELVAGGCTLSDQGAFPLVVGGRLRPGRFELPGDVSSQFVSGLLMAAPLLEGPSEVRVTNPVESRPYVNLTISALAAFGVGVSEKHGEEATTFMVPGTSTPRSPGSCKVEGDWSNAAFWLCAGALGTSPVGVTSLDLTSAQGDRAILGALARFGARVMRKGDTAAVLHDSLHGVDLDVSDIPDLVPILSVLASVAHGHSRLSHAGRLRLKETDRLAAVERTLSSLGAQVSVDGDDLVFEGVEHLSGGTCDSENDHRMAMMASIAATVASGPVTIHGAEAVSKSYPGFYDDFAALGGLVETKEA